MVAIQAFLSGTLWDWGFNAQKESSTPFRFHGANGNGHVAAAVWLSLVHTEAHTSPSSQWLGSFPPLGLKSDQSHIWWTKTHKATATRRHTRFHTQSAFHRHTDASGPNRSVFLRHPYTMNLSYTQIRHALGKDSVSQPSYVRIS